MTPGHPDPEVVTLSADLVRIDSSNPILAPGGAGETKIADYCAAWLDARFQNRAAGEQTGGPVDPRHRSRRR